MTHGLLKPLACFSVSGRPRPPLVLNASLVRLSHVRKVIMPPIWMYLLAMQPYCYLTV